MEIKLARNEINGKPKTITLEKVTEIIEKEGIQLVEPNSFFQSNYTITLL